LAASSWRMAEQDRRLSEAIRRDGSRLARFIRGRVADPRDAEDIVQEVFYELVNANRLMQPIDEVTAWLFRVARNRITDLFRRRAREATDDLPEDTMLDDLLPSPEAGPEAEFARRVLLEEMAEALDELPAEQREAFIAHEIDGVSFNELAERTGVNVKTLLSRKHYAVRHLRERLQSIYDEMREGDER